MNEERSGGVAAMTSSLRMGTDEERGSEILRAWNVGEIIKDSEAFLNLRRNANGANPNCLSSSNRWKTKGGRHNTAGMKWKEWESFQRNAMEH